MWQQITFQREKYPEFKSLNISHPENADELTLSGNSTPIKLRNETYKNVFACNSVFVCKLLFHFSWCDRHIFLKHSYLSELGVIHTVLMKRSFQLDKFELKILLLTNIQNVHINIAVEKHMLHKPRYMWYEAYSESKYCFAVKKIE